MCIRDSATADNSTDIAVLATSGKYAMIAKIQVSSKNRTEDVYKRQTFDSRLKQIDLYASQASEIQQRVLSRLTRQAAQTEWGRKYDYSSIRNYEDFRKRVPIQTYEEIKREGLFHDWLAQRGKLGGQHKVPRLSNTREYIETMLALNDSILSEE